MLMIAVVVSIVVVKVTKLSLGAAETVSVMKDGMKKTQR
jgi:hypothetical protein